MSLDNKRSCKQKFSRFSSRYTPVPVNLDLRLDQRIARVQRKGHLSVKLAYFKKQLEPIQQPPHIKQLKQINKLRQNRRLSLQVLPKLHQYDLPINQIVQNQHPQTVQKSQRKAPFLKHTNNKFKKIVISDQQQFDKIDKILFKVIEQENNIDRKIEQDLQKHLTYPLSKKDEQGKRMFDAKMEAIEKLNYEYRQLEPKSIQNRIRERLSSKESIETKHKSPSVLGSQRRRYKKSLEYKGWEIQKIYDYDDFLA